MRKYEQKAHRGLQKSNGQGTRWVEDREPTFCQVSVMNSAKSYIMSPWTSIWSFSVGPWKHTQNMHSTNENPINSLYHAIWILHNVYALQFLWPKAYILSRKQSLRKKCLVPIRLMGGKAHLHNWCTTGKLLPQLLWSIAQLDTYTAISQA